MKEETGRRHFKDYFSRLAFNMPYPTHRMAYTTAFDTPVVEHWLEREIPQWVQQMGSI